MSGFSSPHGAHIPQPPKAHTGSPLPGATPGMTHQHSTREPSIGCPFESLLSPWNTFELASSADWRSRGHHLYKDSPRPLTPPTCAPLHGFNQSAGVTSLYGRGLDLHSAQTTSPVPGSVSDVASVVSGVGSGAENGFDAKISCKDSDCSYSAVASFSVEPVDCSSSGNGSTRRCFPLKATETASLFRPFDESVNQTPSFPHGYADPVDNYPEDNCSTTEGVESFAAGSRQSPAGRRASAFPNAIYQANRQLLAIGADVSRSAVQLAVSVSSDICGEEREPGVCSRTRPISCTWRRYEAWLRRRHRGRLDLRSPSDQSCHTPSTDPQDMLSMGTLVATGGNASGHILATPTLCDVTTGGDTSAATRRPLQRIAGSSGKLVGIAKARQREPEPAAAVLAHTVGALTQPTPLIATSIGGHVNYAGLSGGGLWPGRSAAAGDLTLTSGGWGVSTTPHPQQPPLSVPQPLWLHNPAPAQYAPAPIYTGLQSYQLLQTDSAAGQWMILPRSAPEPTEMRPPTLMWSPYPYLSPQPQPQQASLTTLMPQHQASLPHSLTQHANIQPRLQFVQQMDSAINSAYPKRDDSTAASLPRLKPIQPAPAHNNNCSSQLTAANQLTAASANQLTVGAAANSQLASLQYIIPAAPLQSVYYTAEPAPFFFQSAVAPPILHQQPPQMSLQSSCLQPPIITAVSHSGLPSLTIGSTNLQHQTSLQHQPKISPSTASTSRIVSPPAVITALASEPESANQQSITAGVTSSVDCFEQPQLSPMPLSAAVSREVNTRSQGTSPVHPADGGLTPPPDWELGQSQSLTPPSYCDSDQSDASGAESNRTACASAHGSVAHRTPNEADLSCDGSERGNPSVTGSIARSDDGDDEAGDLSDVRELSGGHLCLPTSPPAPLVDSRISQTASVISPVSSPSSRAEVPQDASEIVSSPWSALDLLASCAVVRPTQSPPLPSVGDDVDCGLLLLCDVTEQLPRLPCGGATEHVLSLLLRAAGVLSSDIASHTIPAPTPTSAPAPNDGLALLLSAALTAVPCPPACRPPMRSIPCRPGGRRGPPAASEAPPPPVVVVRSRYSSLHSARTARSWLKRRAAAGYDNPQDPERVCAGSIDLSWSESPLIARLQSQLVDLQRLYRQQLKLARVRGGSPNKRRSSEQKSPMLSARGRPPNSGVSRAPAPPPVSAPSSAGLGSIGGASGEASPLLWRDRQSADSPSIRGDAKHSNGVPALAEPKKRKNSRSLDSLEVSSEDDDSASLQKRCRLKSSLSASISPASEAPSPAVSSIPVVIRHKMKPTLKAEVITRNHSVCESTEADGGEVVSKESHPCLLDPNSSCVGAGKSANARSSTGVRHISGTPSFPDGRRRSEGTSQSTTPSKSQRKRSHTSSSLTAQKLSNSSGHAHSNLPSISSLAESAVVTAAQLGEDTRLLVCIEGLFYRSEVTPLQPPDIYGVSVDGERHHRPQIYTQEQLLTQTVCEVFPRGLDQLTPGTRVLANWSPHLRGLFPGTVSRDDDVTPPPEGMLYVEFDDGDSGYMRLEGIRLLPPQYPRVDRDDDPLTTLISRRRRVSSGASVTSAGSRSLTAAHPLCFSQGLDSGSSSCAARRRSTAVSSDHRPANGSQARKRRKRLSDPELQAASGGSADTSDSRQCWSWYGKGVKRPASKAKSKREEFSAIQRRNEIIKVGDCAVFQSTGVLDRPYVGRVQSLWETPSGRMMVRVAWFYRPEETVGCHPDQIQSKSALFESGHTDENSVHTISHRCCVMPHITEFRSHMNKIHHQADDNDDDDDDARGQTVFYRAGFYEPRTQRIFHKSLSTPN